MPIVNTQDLLNHARTQDYTVPVFEILNLETLETVLSAAEDWQSPVILAVSESQFIHDETLHLLSAIESAAQSTTLPVGVQLSSATQLELVIKAINAGCNSVKPDKTIIDKQTIEPIKTVLNSCGIPLIDDSSPAVSFSDAINLEIARQKNFSDYTSFLQLLKTAVCSKTEATIEACKSSAQASASLKHCQPWEPIEHLIIFNVEGIDDQQAEAMMAEGRESLATIPGVRHVITAKAIKEDAKYRFSWLIGFCHPAVIDSYREHPVHVDFADRLFRPVASDRISIDYQWNHSPQTPYRPRKTLAIAG